MATPLVNATTTHAWTDIAGAAASVAGVTWVNAGDSEVALAFQTVQPVDTDPIVPLQHGDAVTDDSGSAHVWARSYNGAGRLCAWSF